MSPVRLELPLPWPGLPPVNAWALDTADGLVLVDCGLGGVEPLERALEHAGLALADVGALVCTHAHPDHAGNAAAVVERTGCELWLHPGHRHGTAPWPAQVAHRDEVARRAGVPGDVRRRFVRALREQDPRVPPLPAPHGHLVDGVELGGWRVVETPGHAPSHVCLFDPRDGLLIGGDHLLEEPALGFDVGHAPDPIAQFGASLQRVEELGARRCLPGHGAPFDDVGAALDRTREAVLVHLEAVRQALPGSAYELAGKVFGAEHAGRLFAETLAFARHLEADGRAARTPEVWSAPSVP